MKESSKVSKKIEASLGTTSEFLLVPMWSLWTQLENNTGPSVPLVAMLLVPNGESKADLLCTCRNLDLPLCFGISFVLLKSAFDRISSNLRIYNIYINIYNIYINRPRQQNNSLAASARTACSVWALNDSQSLCLFIATGQTGQQKPSLEWSHSSWRLGTHPLSAEFQEFTPDPN